MGASGGVSDGVVFFKLNGVGVRADGAFRWSFRWSGVFEIEWCRGES
jgi:hypothetical protein